MASPPPTLDALVSHLNSLAASALSVELDVRLVETFTAQLTDDGVPALIPTLVPLLSATLPHLRTDPTSLTALLQRLLARVSFTDLLPLAAQDTVLQALSSPSPPIQHLGLFILSKASSTAAEASIVASWIDVLHQLVRLALVDVDTGVASSAADVLIALLTTDYAGAGGAGLVWKRVFSESGVYALFYTLPSWKGEQLESNRRKTEAQGRLLSLLPRIAELDFELLAKPRHPAVEEGKGGLLAWAGQDMVNADDDVMLHMVLIDFYAALLTLNGLHILRSIGVHERTVNLYLAPGSFTDDPLDGMLLESKSADYIAALFNSSDPSSGGLVKPLVETIKTHLTSSPQEPHAPSLVILRSLPREALEGTGVAAALPIGVPAPEYLAAFATLFKSKRLYAEVLAAHPEFFQKATEYAGTPALGPSAIAALDIIDALAEESWDNQPPVAGVAENGAEELVKRHSEVLEWLGYEPERFVGGAADRESWAWRVARRRWEVCGSVGERVAGSWKSLLEKRYRAGVWGQGRGLEVATEEA